MESNIDPEINSAGLDAGDKIKMKSLIDADAVDTATRALKVLQDIPADAHGNEVDESLKDAGDAGDKLVEVRVEEDDGVEDENDQKRQKTKKAPKFKYYDESGSSKPATQEPSIEDVEEATRRFVGKVSYERVLGSPTVLDQGLNFVMMDPSTKAGLSKRLGRPKKVLNTTSTPHQSSLSNSNDSVISRFRFDDNPSSRANGNKKGAAAKNGARPLSRSRQITFKAAREISPGVVKLRKKTVQHGNGLKMVIEEPELKRGGTKMSPQAVTDGSGSSGADSGGNAKKRTRNQKHYIVIENFATLEAKGRSTIKDDTTKFKASNRTRQNPEKTSSVVEAAKNALYNVEDSGPDSEAKK